MLRWWGLTCPSTWSHLPLSAQLEENVPLNLKLEIAQRWIFLHPVLMLSTAGTPFSTFRYIWHLFIADTYHFWKEIFWWSALPSWKHTSSFYIWSVRKGGGYWYHGIWDGRTNLHFSKDSTNGWNLEVDCLLLITAKLYQHHLQSLLHILSSVAMTFTVWSIMDRWLEWSCGNLQYTSNDNSSNIIIFWSS